MTDFALPPPTTPVETARGPGFRFGPAGKISIRPGPRVRVG